jgi:hypothetical protein
MKLSGPKTLAIIVIKNKSVLAIPGQYALLSFNVLLYKVRFIVIKTI